MKLHLGLGFTRAAAVSGGPPPSLADQVEAILSGTTGFALDPSDTATMFQDTGETTPVTTIGNPVRRIKSKWGTTVYNFDAPSDAARPAWDGAAGLDFDGSDDFIRLLATDVLRNKPAAFFCTHEKMDALNYYSIHFSTDSGGNQRFSCSINGAGSWAIGGRILDGDSTTFISSAAGVIATGVEYVLSAQINYAVGKGVTGWKDGVSVISGTLGGTAGNTSNTASVTANFNGYNAGTVLKNGKTGRVVMLPSIPSDSDRSIIEAWVGELSL